MITGGQKQTSVWAANNTREQAARRVAAVVVVMVMMGWRRGEGGMGWRDGWYS